MTAQQSSNGPLVHLTEEDLLSQLHQELLPRHVAIIMDGNGRWASLRGLPRIAGHREGLTALRVTLDTCYEVGIPIVTIYAFSQENWMRPKVEVRLLMNLLQEFLQLERQTFQDRRIRFLPIGRLDALPRSVQTLVYTVMEETQQFSDRVLAVALSYGARTEILDAVNQLLHDVQTGKLHDFPITEEVFQQYLATQNLPDPDLLIRTSGETRISNFLLWQIAYTELYFTTTLWPDFRRREVLLALLDYQKRERRFGRLSQHATSHPL
ncbi:MAG: isoprenyl transferase [Nitrospirae bacterium]|nr:MAG: isoprenyl transferase [Nitrospirota bacterium]